MVADQQWPSSARGRRKFRGDQRTGFRLQRGRKTLFVLDEDQILSRRRLDAGNPADFDLALPDETGSHRFCYLIQRVLHGPSLYSSRARRRKTAAKKRGRTISCTVTALEYVLRWWRAGRGSFAHQEGIGIVRIGVRAARIRAFQRPGPDHNSFAQSAGGGGGSVRDARQCAVRRRRQSEYVARDRR